MDAHDDWSCPAGLEGGPLAGAELPWLWDGLRGVLEDGCAGIVECDLARAPADARTIDALARLQVVARRLGCRLRLRHMAPELVDLLEFAGLAGVLGVEAGREGEEREQPGGVQEEGELGQPAP
jgi:hypothetical protein